MLMESHYERKEEKINDAGGGNKNNKIKRNLGTYYILTGKHAPPLPPSCSETAKELW